MTETFKPSGASNVFSAGKEFSAPQIASLCIEQPDLLTSQVGCDALSAHRGDNQVGQTDGGRTSAKKEDPLILEMAAGDLECVDQPS